MKKIVVVILNYNDAETTLKLANKIYKYKLLDTVLIVDNCSTDDSLSYLGENINKGIILLESGKNKGYGYGNNFGIRYAYNELKATHVIVANPDVEFSEELVVDMSEAFNKKKCAIVAPTPIYSNGRFQDNPGWKLTSLLEEVLSVSVLYNRLIGGKKKYNKNEFESNSIMPVDVVQGSLLMLDTSVMMKYGMYDEDFFLFMEEQVLAKKIMQAGYKSYLLTKSTYIHHHSVTIKKIFNSLLGKNKLLNKSRILYYKKYLGMSNSQEFVVRLFFVYCSLEAILITIIKRIREK